MSVYGNTAIAAVEKIKEKYKNIDANTKIVITRENAVAVWEYAVQTKTESEASRKKGCPKAAFIGLCEDNYIKGITTTTKSESESENKRYAKEAAEYLLSFGDINRPPTKQELWKQVKKPKAFNENGQMQVVIELWKKGMLQNPSK